MGNGPGQKRKTAVGARECQRKIYGIGTGKSSLRRKKHEKPPIWQPDNGGFWGKKMLKSNENWVFSETKCFFLAKALDFYEGGATFIGNAPGWRNGRRNRLKICRNIHAGSSPAPGILIRIIRENDKKTNRTGKKTKKSSGKQLFFGGLHNKT